MSAIVELSEKFAEWGLKIISEHGILIGFLALLGVVAIISAIGQKVFMVFRYFFMIFIAIPAILVVGLINRNERKQRLKELKDIKAHLKKNPDKWKRMLYYGLFLIMVLVIMAIVYIFVTKYLLPFAELNEYSKQVLANNSNFTNSS